MLTRPRARSNQLLTTLLIHFCRHDSKRMLPITIANGLKKDLLCVNCSLELSRAIVRYDQPKHDKREHNGMPHRKNQKFPIVGSGKTRSIGLFPDKKIVDDNAKSSVQ